MQHLEDLGVIKAGPQSSKCPIINGTLKSGQRDSESSILTAGTSVLHLSLELSFRRYSMISTTGTSLAASFQMAKRSLEFLKSVFDGSSWVSTNEMALTRPVDVGIE
jgi:hypothetical protein